MGKKIADGLRLGAEAFRRFWEKRKRKSLALWVALAALGAYFLLGLVELPLPQTRPLKAPLPAPAATLGEGEVVWGLVLWWRCPACKRLLERLEPGLLGERPWSRAFHLYFYDLSSEDAEKTALFLCIPGDTGKKLWELSRKEVMEDAVAPLRASPCFLEALERSREAQERLRQNRVDWTPALILNGKLLAPEERYYGQFLWDVLRERW